MEEIKKKNKTNNIVAFAGLTLMIVVFPLTSWYYLQKGFDYQMDARSQLKDHGKVGTFEFSSNLGDAVTEKDFEGNFSVATFINADDESITSKYFDILYQLHEQFDVRPDVKFFTHLSSQDQNVSTLLNDVPKAAKFLDTEQLIFLTANQEQLQQQAKKGYRLPSNDSPFAQNSQIALVDTVGTILNYYDFKEEEQIRRLVEHIAMIVPKGVPEKPVKQVEAER